MSLPVLIRPSNSWGLLKYNLSGLWYISDITPSCNGELPSKLVFSSESISNMFPGISGTESFTSLGGGLETGSGVVDLFYLRTHDGPCTLSLMSITA